MNQPREQIGSDHDPLDLPAVLRALRRRADLSQRELATRSGVPTTTVADVESGGSASPRLRTVERLVAATGARLTIVDVDGSRPFRLDTDDWRDRAGRRFPPHLDVRQLPPDGFRRGVVFEFIRNRHRRGFVRRWLAGQLWEDLSYDVRRLEPGDVPVLQRMRAEAAELDLAGCVAPVTAPLPDHEALCYLREPSLRHWVAEECGIANPAVRGRVLGHLSARLHRHHTGRTTLTVLDIGIRDGHRDGQVGPLLAAALADEAARHGVTEVVAVPAHRTAARQLLRHLGFRRRLRRPLLTLTR